jgi:hypothetical protein
MEYAQYIHIPISPCIAYFPVLSPSTLILSHYIPILKQPQVYPYYIPISPSFLTIDPGRSPPSRGLRGIAQEELTGQAGSGPSESTRDWEKLVTCNKMRFFKGISWT